MNDPGGPVRDLASIVLGLKRRSRNNSPMEFPARASQPAGHSPRPADLGWTDATEAAWLHFARWDDPLVSHSLDVGRFQEFAVQAWSSAGRKPDFDELVDSR